MMELETDRIGTRLTQSSTPQEADAKNSSSHTLQRHPGQQSDHTALTSLGRVGYET